MAAEHAQSATVRERQGVKEQHEKHRPERPNIHGFVQLGDRPFGFTV
jgi:hypothetical protein